MKLYFKQKRHLRKFLNIELIDETFVVVVPESGSHRVPESQSPGVTESRKSCCVFERCLHLNPVYATANMVLNNKNVSRLYSVFFFIGLKVFVHLAHLKLPQISQKYLKFFVWLEHLIKIRLVYYKKKF